MSKKPWLTHYDMGVPEEINIPEITLVDLLRHAAMKYGDSLCVISDSDRFTFNEIDHASDTFAHFLITNGLQKGERVGILLSNSPAFVISYYGILKSGGVVMAFNPACRPAEFTSQARESDIRFLILNSEIYHQIKSLPVSTGIKAMVVIGGEDLPLPLSDIAWKHVFTTYGTGDIQIKIHPDDPAVFQYSGGTTGYPKCAVGLHKNLVANVYQFTHWLVNTTPGKETVLVAIPMYHVYGMVLGMNLAVKMGAGMVLIPDPRDLDHLLMSIEKFRVTIFPGVPNMYAGINRYPPVLQGRYDLSSIKACISGSATLPIQVKRDFERLTHGHLVEGYGLSEAPTATHCNPILGDNREGSIGLPLPNVDCKIVDLTTGTQELPVGEVGELIVKGPQVMQGYYGQPGETAQVIRKGWLFTGDVARMDEDGYFYLVDRKKDVIKVGGFQVWPNEIETVINSHPKVKETAVAGVQDIDGNEVVKAWVVLEENEHISVKELQDFCDQYLTRYKIPRVVDFRNHLPRTAVGKILRRVLVSEGKLGQ